MMAAKQQPRIAVLLPCYNEEAAIAQTVAGFRAALPAATIYVYDNNSRDRTREVAAAAGAIVRTREDAGQGPCRAPDVRRRRGRHLCDGRRRRRPTTPAAAPAHGRPARRRAARHGRRRPQVEVEEAYRRGHVLGNRLFTGFSPACSAAASPISSRATASSRAASSRASRAVARLRDRDRDQRPRARARHAGRRGRHRLWRPPRRLGLQALHLSRRLADPEDDPHLYRIERPGPLLRRLRRCCSPRSRVVLAVPLAITYFQTGLVPRFPTAILVTGLMILAFLSFFGGLILDTVVRGGARCGGLPIWLCPLRAATQV